MNNVTKIADIISKRRSYRSFDSEKYLSKEQITALCEAAILAPSCLNDQPYIFMIFDKSRDVQNWTKAFECLSEANQIWAINAPVLIGVIANNKFKLNGNTNNYACYDTGAAAQNICLQAVEMGLISHQMAGFSENKFIESFEIPADFTILTLIAVGYQDSADKLPEPFLTRETEERFRRDINENCFFGNWNIPLKQ